MDNIEKLIKDHLKGFDSDVVLAIELLVRYGQTDGAHHKQWVIDQAVRTLTGNAYESLIADYKSDGGDPDAYEWDEGIAP